MKNRTTIFSKLFVVIIAILIIASLVALYSIHYKLIFEDNLVFNFNPEGINTYFSAYSVYKSLLGSTIATIAAYLGLLRLEVAAEANIEKLKQDRFTEWKSILEIRFLEIDEKNPFMKREFIKERGEFFDLLYERKMEISDKQNLIVVFDNCFKKVVDFFETNNKNYQKYGGIYKDTKQLYAYDSFQFLFMGCVPKYYPEIFSDLEQLYRNAIDQNRIISLASHAIAGMNANRQ